MPDKCICGLFISFIKDHVRALVHISAAHGEHKITGSGDAEDMISDFLESLEPD